MTERHPSQECSTCPNRSKLSKTLAKVVGRNTLYPGCPGPSIVLHGTIETQVRQWGEPPLDKAEFDYAWKTGGGTGQEARYSKIDVERKTICGKEPIEPRPGEVLYDPQQPTQTKEDGRLVGAFVMGSEQQITDLRVIQDMKALLQATSDMQAAESIDDTAGVQAAQGQIAAQGFSLKATAGRYDGQEKIN